MESRSTSAEPAVRLNCLGGALAPADLAIDLALFPALPANARRSLWAALGPTLREPLPPSIEGLLDGFCREHGADGSTLARVIKACRFLVREAIKVDLPLAAFLADVEALTDEGSQIRAALSAGYEKAYALLRREMLRDALVSGGAVLTGIDWRVDAIRSTSNGIRASAPVALLTLKYVDGDKAGRLVLHMPIATVAELKQACEEILKV